MIWQVTHIRNNNKAWLEFQKDSRIHSLEDLHKYKRILNFISNSLLDSQEYVSNKTSHEHCLIAQILMDWAEGLTWEADWIICSPFIRILLFAQNSTFCLGFYITHLPINLHCAFHHDQTAMWEWNPIFFCICEITKRTLWWWWNRTDTCMLLILVYHILIFSVGVHPSIMHIWSWPRGQQHKFSLHLLYFKKVYFHVEISHNRLVYFKVT